MNDKPRKITRKKLALMRAASTQANYSHGMGGLTRKRPKKITLPPVPWKSDDPRKPHESQD